MPAQTQTSATRQVDLTTSVVVGELTGGEGSGERNATRGRNGGGRFTTTLKGQQRDIEAARLQSMGWSLSKIAGALGYSSTGHVVDGIQRAFDRIPSQAVEVRRAQQQQLIDVLKTQAIGVMMRDHVAHSQGRIVKAGCPGLDSARERLHVG